MIQYPHIPNKDIEASANRLLLDYHRTIDQDILAPIPVIEMIEYLGYDLDFSSEGVYQDPNYLGGLHLQDKRVVINDHLVNQEGRLHFTAAHEIGHITLHVPQLINKNNHNSILCREGEGVEGNKKAPEEWQADTFAAYLLMPKSMVIGAFKKIASSPITLKNKWFLSLFMKTRSPRERALWVAEKVIKAGHFDNVSKLAMANRLIGLDLLKGLKYQKAYGSSS